jgi:3-dehydroquinate synthase
LSDRMLAARFGRDSAVIALGGGVVGDVAGFVAATYLRGVPLVQVPTSLLAMIDSSIGGKTGVDVVAGKNLLGSFHQPRLVVADLELLRSLSTVQLAAGLAEAVKHGVIADMSYFEFLEQSHAAIFDKDLATLEQVVRRSVEIKAAVVAQDEKEAGRRSILNFGHTVGHAIEATSKYEVLHGEAVAIGMTYEARLAESLDIAVKGTTRRIVSLLEQLRLPTERPGSSPVNQLIDAMQSDKKARDGMIRVALPRQIGVAYGDATHGWTVPVSEEQLRQLLHDD